MQVTMLFCPLLQKKKALSELLPTLQQTGHKDRQKTPCVFSLSACYAISDDSLFHFTTPNDEPPLDSSCQDPLHHHL